MYIDLNMVRAGVVAHPAQWEVGGYHEIQEERLRYRVVDRRALADALGIELPRLAEAHRGWVETALQAEAQQRNPLWTESVAVGGREFVEAVQRKLADRGRYREIEEVGGIHILHEPAVAYGGHVPGENTPISTNWA